MYFASVVLRNTNFMFKIKHYKLKDPQTKKVAYGHAKREGFTSQNSLVRKFTSPKENVRTNLTVAPI